MAIVARITAEPNQVIDLGIERLSDGAWFDWTSGAFSASPTAPHLSLPQAASYPGRYAGSAPHQKPAQFVAGQVYAVYVFTQTGLSAPTRDVLIMVGFGCGSPPWHLVGYNHAIIFSETQTTF